MNSTGYINKECCPECDFGPQKGPSSVAKIRAEQKYVIKRLDEIKENSMKSVEEVAQLCHELNKTICEVHGDNSQKSWKEAEEWQRDSAIQGVIHKVINPLATPEDQHNQWCEHKFSNGWVYGEIKDAELKTHPCLVKYDELPLEQRLKDIVFSAVVLACVGEQ
jgi:hypothetical protein